MSFFLQWRRIDVVITFVAEAMAAVNDDVVVVDDEGDNGGEMGVVYRWRISSPSLFFSSLKASVAKGETKHADRCVRRSSITFDDFYYVRCVEADEL